MVNLYIPSESKVVHVTRVDFIKRPASEPIHIVQYDKTIPILEVHLYLNDLKYVLPEGMDVRVRWGKKDRTFVYKNILGCNEARDTIYLEIDEQMSFYSGIVYPIIELKVSESVDDEIAGSGPIPVVIDPNPILDSDVESQSEFFDLNPNQDISQIRDGFILSLKKSYKEVYSNNNNQVYLVDIWDDSSKTTHLFTKSISYDEEGRPDTVTIQDMITGNTLVKNLTYIDDNTMGVEEIVTRV